MISSMANVLSNLMISKSQIITFFNILGTQTSQICVVKQWLKNDAPTDKNGYVAMQTFTEYLDANPGYLTPLDRIRGILVRNIIGENAYYNIKKRRNYYQECILLGKAIDEPNEPCFMKLFRILFTREPNPYHCDFRSYLTGRTIEECLAIIRKRYGYSARPLRGTAVSISSNSNSIHQNFTSARSSRLNRYNSSHSAFHFNTDKYHPSINSSSNKGNKLSRLYKSNRVMDGSILE